MRTKKILKEQNETVPITIPDKDGNPLAVYPKEMVDTIKATVAKGATNEELVMFLSIANQYGLNPFMKEIWFTKMGDESAIMTSRDGFKKLAERKPNFKKCQSVAVYENDEFEMEYDMGELTHITHKFKQNDRGAIKGAYAVLRTTDDGQFYNATMSSEGVKGVIKSFNDLKETYAEQNKLVDKNGEYTQ